MSARTRALALDWFDQPRSPSAPDGRLAAFQLPLDRSSSDIDFRSEGLMHGTFVRNFH
jgi:hypothetical protein